MFDDEIRSETGRGDFLAALEAGAGGGGERWPGANAIKRGVAGEFPRVAEDAAAVIGREQECFGGFMPQNGWQAWLLEQLAVTTLRIDRCGRAERRLRDSATIRAALDWDEERASRAEAAGARIGEAPAAALAELRSTPHGCDWLIRRWAILGRAAEENGAWAEAQVALAHDLLGTPTEGRDREPGPGLDGGDGVPLGRSGLARREVDALKRRKVEVGRPDAIERAMAEADLAIEPTRELKQLGRHEAMLRRWLRWLVAQVRVDAPKRLSPTGLYPRLPEEQPERQPEAQADPRPRAGVAATAEPETETETDPESESGSDATPSPSQGPPPPPRIASSTRKDPRAIRDAARSEAGRRKRELRRA